MSLQDLVGTARMSFVGLVVVCLGSCAIIDVSDNRLYIEYTLDTDTGKPRCDQFVRSARLGHAEPIPPMINGSNISPAEFAETVLTYAESMKSYIDAEKKYLAEDIARHESTCN